MAETKLTNTKIPTRKGKETPKKLGLLTPDRRRMVSFKLDPQTIASVLELVTAYKQSFFYSLTKTDILETALMDFLSKDEAEHLALLQKYGVERKKV